MEKAQEPAGAEALVRPTGGVPLSEERLRALLPQWEGMYRSIRRMDAIPLGDTEPATLFVWDHDEP